MRKSSTPVKLTLQTTVSILVINLLILFVFGQLYSEMGWLVFPLGMLTTTIFTYFIIFHTLESFIYKKIKLIYKTIHRLKRGISYNESELTQPGDLFENVNREVQEWAFNQTAEIQHLKEMAQYRREFVGNVSHELKTPIFNIQGYVDTLLDGGLYDSKINMAYLEKTARSVERMINIVKDLETISNIEAGRIEMNLINFNLVELSKEVIEMLEDKAHKKRIHLFLAKGMHQLPIMVHGDRDKIRQVFVNLIDNAAKYIGSNQNAYIKISFYDMDENILVEVSDNGMGIAAEHLPHIFDRFYRVDKARSSDQGGTGLGLSIVKHILEAHQQTINVRSTPEIGSTFSFTIKKGR